MDSPIKCEKCGKVIANQLMVILWKLILIGACQEMSRNYAENV